MGAVEESSASEVERLYRTNVVGLLNVMRARNDSDRHLNSWISLWPATFGFTGKPRHD
jgi:hypothetical protein